ncbi:hypothetical protein I6F14_23840 [Bradyrhizobium sp. IC3069]|uniref:hypothetical protein n=1 Tax=unclassified Bradyrhizobium TaxID=2631580 RepID=UPI001CD64D73|nr:MULTISPECIES: hypothetical protein [unclassified Bradyrhizobium]MCA1363431.1 hypothetical protein [Bradyrhizobium sp. IC4059]MCA1520969.1 hypothetical protein [Bradyrhizobium sp. IC3069]
MAERKTQAIVEDLRTATMSKVAAAQHVVALTKNRLSALRRTSKGPHLNGLETPGEPPFSSGTLLAPSKKPADEIPVCLRFGAEHASSECFHSPSKTSKSGWPTSGQFP